METKKEDDQSLNFENPGVREQFRNLGGVSVLLVRQQSMTHEGNVLAIELAILINARLEPPEIRHCRLMRTCHKSIEPIRRIRGRTELPTTQGVSREDSEIPLPQCQQTIEAIGSMVRIKDPAEADYGAGLKRAKGGVPK